MLSNTVNKFLHYVSFSTTSNEESNACPSTEGQRVFADALAKELRAAGLSDAAVDENGYLFATVPETKPGCKTLGLIAHMDTSPDAPGKNVKPRVLTYEGGDILLNAEKNIVMKAADYPSLSGKIGHKLIVTDGTTLLGADDKAGVAEIAAAADYLLSHPEIPHGKIRIGFTPDEEIGRGADLFDVRRFGADFAYTVDGGGAGEIEYENFNAASMQVTVNGVSIHPGSAKDHMINASLVAMEFEALLPAAQKPQYTEGYDGFFHLCGMQGEVEKAELFYIIRDHDAEKFEQKKQAAVRAAAFLNEKYGENTVVLQIADSYRNMKEQILPHMYLIDMLHTSAKAVGLNPVEVAIRGGTDGARLSFMGLPCPNIGTGGQNFHGRFEYADTDEMDKVTMQLVELCRLAAML